MSPWGCCKRKSQAGHTTREGGAHAVPSGWREKWIPILLTACTLASGDGAVLQPMRPAVSALQAAGGSSIAPTFEFMPIRGEPSHALVPFYFGLEGIQVGAPTTGGLFGAPRGLSGREDDYAQAGRGPRAARRPIHGP